MRGESDTEFVVSYMPRWRGVLEKRTEPYLCKWVRLFYFLHVYLLALISVR